MKSHMIVIVILATIFVGSQVVFGQDQGPNVVLTEIIVPQFIGPTLGGNMPTAVRLKASSVYANTDFKLAIGFNASSEELPLPLHSWTYYNYMFGYYYIVGGGQGGAFGQCYTNVHIGDSTVAGTVLYHAAKLRANSGGEATFWALLAGDLSNNDSRFNAGKTLWIVAGVNDMWNAYDWDNDLAYVCPDRSVLETVTIKVANVNPGAPYGYDYDCAFLEGRSYAPSGSYVFVYSSVDGSDRPLSGTMVESRNISLSNWDAPGFYSSEVAGHPGRYGLVIPVDPAQQIKYIRVYNSDGTVYAEQAVTGPSNNGDPLVIGQTYLLDETAAPLPVELTTFSGKLVSSGSEVALNWTTATEVNFSSFKIQRQSGEAWVNVGEVKANGNSNSPKNYSFHDTKISSAMTYNYRLQMVDNDGTSKCSQSVSVSTGKPSFKLAQNYPNPFNPNTKISYSLPDAAPVSLKVYNALGQEVITLVNEDQPAGIHTVDFNGSNLPSGVYVYQLQAGTVSGLRKMILMK